MFSALLHANVLIINIGTPSELVLVDPPLSSPDPWHRFHSFVVRDRMGDPYPTFSAFRKNCTLPQIRSTIPWAHLNFPE